MRTGSLYKGFWDFCRRKGLLHKGDRIVAAVSGGIDSSVLLDLLAKSRDALGLDVIVAHVNFRLRGDESDADEAFVTDRARHYGCEFHGTRVETRTFASQHKMGMQEAARVLRYEFFERVRLDRRFGAVATAHNADDNAETVVMNLFRGAGVGGLAGIPPVRDEGRIVRPLLFATREEIAAYAAGEHVPYREDSSNAGDDYVRNFIRHQILPPVKERMNPNIAATLGAAAEVFRELESYLRREARRVGAEIVLSRNTDELALSVEGLQRLPRLLQHYIVMHHCGEFARIPIDAGAVTRVLALTDNATGSMAEIDGRTIVVRDRAQLVFRRREDMAEFNFAVLPSQTYRFGHFTFSAEVLETTAIPRNGGSVEYVDADKTGGEMILHSWREGDWFVPLGMKAGKKVSDFFVDAKVPVYEKPRIPILATKDGRIVWVCGYRIDDRFKVTPQTRRVMKLQFSTTM